MAILRIQKKQGNFLVLDKTSLNDENLSWGAKGLHAYLMSLPDDWTVKVSDLQKRSANGRDAVRSLIKQLEQAGFIKSHTKRDEKNGKFQGVDYLVLEVPEHIYLAQKQTAQEQASSDCAEKNSGSTKLFCQYPHPEKPEPGNPTLINNQEQNNNTTAVTKENSAITTTDVLPQLQNVAAVVNSHVFLKNKSPQLVERLSGDESLIGSALTQTQKQRITNFLSQIQVDKKEILADEIEYTLLNPRSFNICGKDFSRKLNAIRKVILRGDWQTPVGMLDQSKKASKAQSSEDLALNSLKQAYAEYQHFQKLSLCATDEAKGCFEKILIQVKAKIKNLEAEVQQHQALRSA